jgi:hypothetical protein
MRLRKILELNNKWKNPNLLLLLHSAKGLLVYSAVEIRENHWLIREKLRIKIKNPI